MASTEATPLSHQKQNAGRGLVRHLKEWSYEGLSMLISAASFTGLVIALQNFNGKRQEDWMYTHITRNTIIAAISTIVRTSLLTAVTISISQNKWAWFSQRPAKGRRLKDLETFDSASRGAKGCLHLLAVTKFHQIASLGALVVVLTLAFDTFAQNVLAYEFREGPLPSTAEAIGSIQRSETYGSAYSLSTVDWFTFDVPFQMKAAILNGVMGLETPLPPPFCSTGNCTWPIVPSLAMCGQCADVTADIQHDCAEESNYCAYSLPDGAILMGPKPGKSMHDLADAPLTLLNVSAMAADMYSQQRLSNGQKGKIYAGHLTAIQTEIKEKNPGDGLAAIQCDLWFCVQAYQVSIKSGNQEVLITGNWDTATPYTLDNTLGAGADMQSLRNFTDISDPSINANTVFSVSYANARAISLAFQSLTTGSVAWSGNRGAYYYSSDGAQSIWQARHNLSSWIQTVASGVTTAIRSNATLSDPIGSAKTYAGVATLTQSFVKVRWIWILYPSAMLAIGVFHFVATIWQTVWSRGHAWKANPIVSLLLRLEMMNGEARRLDDDGSIPSEILDQKAVLSYDEGRGWSLFEGRS